MDSSEYELNKAALFRRRYGLEIIRKHRCNLFSSEKLKKRKETQQSNSSYATAPTFPEFVSYLLATNVAGYNSHWLPVHLLCRPCNLLYTIVAKTETIERDSRKNTHFQFIKVINPCFRFIRETLGHEKERDDIAKKLEKVHKTNNDDQTGLDNGEGSHPSDSDDTLPASQRFFSQLERKEVEGLIQKYQIDLAMWGYSPKNYLEFAK